MLPPVATTPEPETFLPLIPIPRKPRRLWVRIVMIGGAIVFMALGIASTLIPVAPGFLFWIAGLALLGVSVPAVGRLINRVESKFSPKWRRRLRPKLWRKGRRKLMEVR